ncbi:hypothetical protein EMIT0210MI2_250006 [Priestia megaterium]
MFFETSYTHSTKSAHYLLVYKMILNMFTIRTSTLTKRG